MADILLVAGHGQGDPGANSGGYNERDTMRQLVDKIKALIPNEVDVYDKSLDMFQQTRAGGGMYTTKYRNIIEFHMDAAGSGASGGHVIIYKGYKPDSLDNRLANAIKQRVGWIRPNGFDGRNNLLNLNVAAQRGISYRLLELGFITNASDRNKIIAEMDETARAIANAISNEQASKPNKPTTKHYGNIDKFAVGSREINIEGWFLSTDTNNEVYPYLLFMDGNGKELTRLEAERVLRPDLKTHFPHTANWHKSGFKVKAVTPDILKGKGFRILARMATKPSGEGILYEFYLNGEYSATAKLTAGHIDNVHIDDKHMKISGWHFGDNITKDMNRYLFLLDAKTHIELARVKIDNVARQDVQNVYKQYYLANESGFDVTVDISKLHGRDVKVMTRYATDENGNKTANEKLFDQIYHL